MEQATEATTYLSPLYKLIRFFRDSRDRWKTRAKERGGRIKRLENRVAGLKESRDKWKEKARAQRAEVTRLTKQLEAQKRPHRESLPPSPPRPRPRWMRRRREATSLASG